MRLVRHAALAAALLGADVGAAQAQMTSTPPVATIALAPGEVLLEVSASAIEAAPVASARFRIWAQGSGDTQAAADAARDRLVAQVRQAASAAGATPADIVVEPTEMRTPTMVDVGEEPPPTPRATAGATIRVSLGDSARFDAFRTAVAGTGLNINGRPELVPGDDSAARRTGRTRALAEARADADAYAAALNLRVVRMVRVTERTGPDFVGLMLGTMTGQGLGGLERWAEGRDQDSVPVPVFLGVDFILAPR